MRSQLMPSQIPASVSQNPMDLGLSLDMAQPPAPDSPFVSEWELWGEELTISMCEVRLEYRPGVSRKPTICASQTCAHRDVLAVVTRPLPPLYHPSAQLVDLAFYCPPPNQANSSPAKPNSKGPGTGTRSLYLTATFLDGGDCKYSVPELPTRP